MSRSLEIQVDGPTCISSGYCRNFAPDVFAAGPDKKSVVKQSPVPESPDLQDAWESCPSEAISVRDADTGEAVFP